MKKCFYCNIEKPLTDFSIDRRKYQIKADLGTCKGCKQCYIEKSINDLSVIYFNFEIEKFVIEKFETKEQVIKFIENEENKINFALIKHPVLGEICIHNGLPNELNKLIGTETAKHKDKKPIYSAEIIEDEDGLNIYNLSKMEAEHFNVFFIKYSNRLIENKIRVFKSGVLSITYK